MKTGTRLFSILLALLLALSCGGTREAQAAVASCVNGHNWSDWQGIGATCTEAGWQERTCYNCRTKDRQTIPALGHSWNGGTVTAQPSCTSGGTRTYTCTRSNCGATRSESIGALGHSYGGTQITKPSTCSSMGESYQVCTRCGNRITHVMPKNDRHSWDEGVITREPEGLIPGERTYTCTRCGATRTEAVDPTGGVFNKLNTSLRNIPPSSGSSAADDLRIVTQPEGGTIPQGGSLMLSVEAAGGEEPYAYEWWYEPELLHADMMASAIAKLGSSLGQSFAETIQQTGHDLQPATIAAAAEWFKSHGLEGLTAGGTQQRGTETLQMEAVPFNPMAEFLGRSVSPECSAWKAGNYWCIVYDSSGQHVTSSRVKVTDALYIAVQPESQNIWGLQSVTLTCRAGGGSGQYGYSWYGEDGIAGSLLEDGPSFTVNQAGTYVCCAVDFSTAEMVESNIVQVYSDEATQVDLRPVITVQPSDVELAYREDGQYSWQMTCEAVAYDGDTEHLRYTWSGKTDIGWVPISEGRVIHRSYDHGIFRCRVEDTRTGQSEYSSEGLVYTAMKFFNETEVAYDGKEMTVELELHGGCPPFTVSIYLDYWYHEVNALTHSTVTKREDILKAQYVTNNISPLSLTLPATVEYPFYLHGDIRLVKNNASYNIIVEDALGNDLKYYIKNVR